MSYSYTNTTKGDQKVRPIALGLNSNYAKIADEPNMAKISNKTASLEQPEVITYRSDSVKSVSMGIPVRYPSQIKQGVQYTIKLETIDRNSLVSGDPIDEPISMWLTIKHTNSNNWTNAKVAAILERLLGACMQSQTTTGTQTDATDANWRFEDLMRSAIMPTND